MNKLIGISTSCLYYWVPQKDWVTEQLGIITLLRNYVSRVELYLTAEDILTFGTVHFEQYREATEGLSLSLHLPSLSQESFQLATIFEKIVELMKKLNIEYVVWHSDDFANTEIKVGEILPTFKFGLENSDIRKFGFQHLKDISLLGTYPIILDIDHIEELKKNSLNGEIAELKNKILGIHFSTPTSVYFQNHINLPTTHFPFSRSGNNPPKILPKNTPIVIEGLFPNLEYKLIEEEVALVKKIYFS